MSNKTLPMLAEQMIKDASQWAIMHGLAFRQPDNSARHCPFSIAPMTMKREMFEHLLRVSPLLTKLISKVSEDHEFLASSLSDVAKAEPFFARLLALHQQIHSNQGAHNAARLPLLLMRTDFMDDRQQGAKVIEFNGIAAGMAPFGQRATQLHAYLSEQWPMAFAQHLENEHSTPAPNHGLEQLAYGIVQAANQVKADFKDPGQPTFLMVIQENEDNVYDQHLLELELQRQGLRTIRRTFEQLNTQLSTGAGRRLLLENIGPIDVVYLRAGYQYCDYFAPTLAELQCCHALSQTRVLIEQHHVAVNATVSQQLATSKSMQMLLTMMPERDFERWGLNSDEAILVKSVLADMKPVNPSTIKWFNSHANPQQWVLKNQGEGGGHCIFGEDISAKLSGLDPKEHAAWALMHRLNPHQRQRPTIAIRDTQPRQIDDLVSEIGIFTAFYNGQAITQMNGYAGYLIRSKPACENEGGIHSGQGILDSLNLVDSEPD